MKKILLFITLFLLFPLLTHASTNYEIRTEDNLYVNKSEIVIDSNNLNNVLSTPYVDASEKIYDYADVLTDDEEQSLYEKVMNFTTKSNMDMVIVTIDKEYSDYQIETFADDFFDYNDFGMYTSSTSYDGILVIRNTNDYNRYYYISTSGMAQLYYAGSRLDEVLDAMYNNMHYDNYYAGFVDYIEEASKIYDRGLPTKYEDCHVDNYGNLYDENGNKINFSVGRYVLPLAPAGVVGFIVSLIVVLILIGKNKMIRKAVKAAEYLDKDSVEYTNKQDTFVSSHTSSYTVSSSSGGGSHSGSSGFSHGGGGRHC